MAIQQPLDGFDRAQRKFALERPALFAKRHLGIDLWAKQKEVLTALAAHKRVAVRSCNGSGKTFTAALATIWWLMVHDEAIVITTAPTERQVRELLWREIWKIHFPNRDLIGGRISPNRLEMSKQRFAFGFSTNTMERFQGFHSENILIVVDEASGVREFIFNAILGSMTTRNAKMLLIGNPTTLSGTFYNAFHKNRGHWKTVHISAFDTPAFNRDPDDDAPPTPGIATPEFAEEVAKEYGKDSPQYQFRVLGEFQSEAVDTLIPLKLIEAATKRTVDVPDEQENVMGLDVARFGDSKTVAVVRRGPKVLELHAFRKSDLMQTTGKALELARRHDVKTMSVDEVGLGAGVLDRLNEIDDIEAEGINVGLKARDTERYYNMRAQIFDGLRQRFTDGDIAIPDDAELISQLASLTYRYTSRGQLQLETKDQIRESGRQSPDKADALALAFATPQPRVNPLRIWI